MGIIIKPHAILRMKDREITRSQVYEVLQNPKEVIAVRFGRLVAYGEIEKRKLVVIYEKKDETTEVITALWVDERRLRTLGFTRV
jgi:hypothetical protein